MWSVASPSIYTWIAGFLKTPFGNTGNETILGFCHTNAVNRVRGKGLICQFQEGRQLCRFYSRLQQALKLNPAEGLVFIIETNSMAPSTDTCLPITAAVHL